MDEWMDRWMVCYMGDLHGAFSIRREYAYAIGTRHLELLLDYPILLRRRRRWFLPHQVTPCTLGEYRICCMLQSLPYSRRMFCIACHSFYRIETQRPQEPFLVHATVSPYSFHFFSAFRECERAFYLLFFWANATGNFCWEKKHKTPFKLFFPTRKRVSDTYLSDEKLSKTCSKEKRNFIMNGITVVSTTGSTERRAYILITRLPFCGKTSMYMYEHWIRNIRTNSWALLPHEHDQSSLPHLRFCQNQRDALLQKAVFQHSLQQIIFSIHENVITIRQKLKFQMKRVK